MTSPQFGHGKPERLAGRALEAAIAGDWRRATDVIDRLNKECAGEGLYTALVAWCDIFADHANGGPPEFGKVRMLGWNADTGQLGGEVPERARWVMDLILARSQGDQAAFDALVQRLNGIADGFERGRYISDLLVSMAATMNYLPRGYGRTRRTPEAERG
ncbi:hypothetical protein GA0070622_1210 [Micromonospora sediminicola]|uniref:Uncharacterized protein n=1 Tax=Micromonospora sediminicola TaxID=946078 RepID=A0A1A9B420_9ACTN|nr:hypothetical protein [Micromonospora sediminicola]SBT64240.1 hypothetical protein GA0070622_1210 [Micromonospora sediminicola]